MGSDIQALLDSDVGQPMAQIFYQSFGQKGTLAIWSVIVIVQSVISKSTPYRVTNGFACQVYDGVEYGEFRLHHATQLFSIGPKRHT
jgi:hypothetical protein